MKTTTIHLINPIATTYGSTTAIILREPTAREYLTTGEVFIGANTSNGPMLVEDSAAVAAYLSACIVEPKGLRLDDVSLADGMALKEALFGFFGDARVGGSPTAPMPSSEFSAGPMSEASAPSA